MYLPTHILTVTNEREGLEGAKALNTYELQAKHISLAKSRMTPHRALLSQRPLASQHRLDSNFPQISFSHMKLTWTWYIFEDVDDLYVHFTKGQAQAD